MIDEDRLGPDFISIVIKLTNRDKVVWQEHNFHKKENSSIAYASPWMFCLDTDGRHPVLQVARHFNCFTELEGAEYNLNALDLAISLQCHRAKMAREQPIIELINPKKIEKFGQDKLLHAKEERRRRLKILEKCGRILFPLTDPLELEGV